MKEIGQYLKEKREARGLTISDISRESGICPALIDGIERGDISLFINPDNYDDILSFYCEYMGVHKNALVAQDKILKMHRQRGKTLEDPVSKSAFKELSSVLKLIKERQRVSLDLLEINFGSFNKAKEILQYLQDQGYIVKRSGSSDWLINNEKINEYLRGGCYD